RYVFPDSDRRHPGLVGRGSGAVHCRHGVAGLRTGRRRLPQAKLESQSVRGENMSLKKLHRPLVLCLMMAGLSGSAFAVDGTILIDQNRALAGNVTPGDAPGFPVTISQPGSYKLSGNL